MVKTVPRRIWSILTQDLKAVFTAEVIKAIAIHAEEFGGFGFGVFGLFEGFLHPAALVGFHFLIEAEAFGGKTETAAHIARIGLDEIGRKIGKRNCIGIGHDDEALDGVFELADIAGPGKAFEGAHGVCSDALGLEIVRGAIDLHKIFGEQRNVFDALAKRGDENGDDMDAIVEVFAEASLAYHLFEVFVGGADEAEIHANRFFAAEAREGALFEYAKEFALERGSEGGDFVEEERAIVGELDATFLHGDGAGECAFFVAEELGFHQAFGERGAIHADEGTGAARALRVKRAGDEFFADAAFATNDHVGGSAGHAGDGVEDVAHRVGGANEVAERVFAADFFAQDAILAQDAQLFDGALEKMAKDIGINRLDEVIVGAGVDHFHSGGFRLVGAENDYERVNFAAVEAAEEFGAFLDAAGSHGKGEEHNVELGFLKQRDGGLVFIALEDEIIGAEGGGDFRAEARIVVHDGDLCFGSCGCDGKSPAGEKVIRGDTARITCPTPRGF